MKRKITESQLRKLVYTQLKTLLEAAPATSNAPAQTGPTPPDPKSAQRIAQITSIAKPVVGDAVAPKLAAALSDVKKLDNPADLAAALSSTDKGALADLAIKFVTGEVDKSKLDQLMSLIKQQQASEQKQKVEQEKAAKNAEKDEKTSSTTSTRPTK
jgi:hypothetical protein